MGREVLESFTAQTLHRTYCWLQRDGRLEKSVHDQTSARCNLELLASKHLVRRDILLHKSGGSSALATGKNGLVIRNFMG
jgi:hypothetical protein